MGKDGDTLPELESALFQTFLPFDNTQHFSKVALSYSFAIVTHSLQKYFNGTLIDSQTAKAGGAVNQSPGLSSCVAQGR